MQDVEAARGDPVAGGGVPVVEMRLQRRVAAMLQAGEILLVYPEGTRQHGPKIEVLQPGAAYLALRAGVPIVPVVFRNAGELLAPRANVVRSGTVDICVLEPIDTSDWTTDNGRS